jgi:hypothetical protein
MCAPIHQRLRTLPPRGATALGSAGTLLCGYLPEVTGMSEQPTGVHARGGDTRKQEALGFKYNIDFATGVKRALDYYNQMHLGHLEE